jgi:hypothetical protein
VPDGVYLAVINTELERYGRGIIEGLFDYCRLQGIIEEFAGQ